MVRVLADADHLTLDLLDPELLTPLVTKLFKLTNYGFQPEDFGVTQSKFAVGLQIRCWEAKDLDKYFPADRLADLRSRQEVRQRAREQCDRFIATVDEAGRAEILKGEVVDKMDRTSAPRNSSDFTSPVKAVERRKSRERSDSVLSSAASTGSPTKKMKTVAEEVSPAGTRVVLTGQTKKTKEEREAEKEAKKERDAEKEAKKAEREEEKKKRDEEKKKREAEREEKKQEREAEKKEREAQREAKRLELEEKKA